MATLHEFGREELLKMLWEHPSLAQLEITRNCNQKCCFCFQGCTNQRKYNNLSVKKWKRIIDKLYNLGIKNINFSGGEVYLFDDFGELLSHCKKLQLKTVVNTNGTCDISSCILDIDKIIFSIHGTQELHNKIVRNDRSFECIMKNIRIANENKVPVEINMTVVKSNFEQIFEVYNYLTERVEFEQFSPTLAIQCLNGTDIPHQESFSYSEDLFKKYFKVLDCIPNNKLDLKQGLHSMYFNNKHIYENTTICDSPYCIGGKTKLVIDYMGNVYPCNFFQNEDFYCGNILYGDESFIWHYGKGFEKFRRIVYENSVPDTCKECIKYYKCFSGCRAWTSSYISGKDNVIDNEKDIRCEFTHAFIGT